MKEVLRGYEEAVMEAVVNLRECHRKNGYNPGARVRAISRFGEPDKEGVIAPYGDAWRLFSDVRIPVQFPDHLQPWQASDLVLLK